MGRDNGPDTFSRDFHENENIHENPCNFHEKSLKNKHFHENKCIFP